jgi:soluble lytic murein transglycosylase-like protein
MRPLSFLLFCGFVAAAIWFSPKDSQQKTVCATEKMVAGKEKVQENSGMACGYDPNYDAKKWLKDNKKDKLISDIYVTYDERIKQICMSENVDPRLTNGYVIRAIINRESSGDSLAENKNDPSYGLMALKPSTAQEMKVSPDSLKVPYWNLLAGIRYLNKQLKDFGNMPAAITAYGCGPKSLGNLNPKGFVYFKQIQSLMDAEDNGSSAE